MVASVLLEIKSKSVDKTFDYLVPKQFTNTLKVGMRVQVPFNARTLEGYVLEIKDKTSSEYELKEIIKQLDDEAILNEELLFIGKKWQEETFASLSSIYSTMLPSALKAKKNHNINKKYETYLYLTMPQEKALLYCKNEIQKKVLFLFDRERNVLQKEANKVSSSAVTTLKKNGILKEVQKEAYRYQIGIQELEPKKVLNTEQEQALSKILSFQKKEKTILLHGVTGSGKTEIYMQAIETILSKNKQALILVPEISLTPQFIGNFSKRFGEKIAVLHSGLSDGEKYDEWRKIARGEAKIVIGARSAIFAPLKELGIIIIDECHSDSYKQENHPKYHAMHIARLRSHYHKCPLLLGSATPQLEVMSRAKKGLFELITLSHRAHNNPLPTCLLIDKKESIKKGYHMLSQELEAEITTRLNQKEQVMILLNRRGHSTFIECSSCGFVYKCPYCDITLTYHKSSKNLRCHYCGYTKYIDTTCPKCHEDALNYYGLGTEKLENYLKEKFPEARIVRMDTDTTRKKGSLEKIMQGFQQGTYDILIGTQMISKGLDFPNVTLVGILNADSSLNIPDFRSGEKTFSLIYQTSGRAGRSTLPGKVFIETYNPDNKILNFVKNQDYDGFYQYEMNIRKQLKYPPYYFLVRLTLKGKDYEKVRNEASKVASYLKKNIEKTSMILGPTTANIFRINNVYHFEILIKYRFDEKLKQSLEELDHIFLLNKIVDLDIDFSA